MNLKTPNQARNDGCALTKEDIDQLRTSIKGVFVTKADASEAEYNAAVQRWNKVYIKEAVREALRLWNAALLEIGHVAPLSDPCSLCTRRR